MNTFKKFTLGVLASIVIAAPAAASPSIVTALPDLSILTTEVGRWIAEEWEGLRKVLLSVPRAARSERAAAVIIFEGTNHMIVTASRLTDESDALTAQR